METNIYKPVLKFDMLDPHNNMVDRLNKIALVAIFVGCIAATILNYCLRMLGEPGGLYLVYIICGVVGCFVYIYIHELTHALGIILIKRKTPKVKFGKLAAWCGSDEIVFTKAQYFFVASLPFFLYLLILTPLCILLPPMYFPVVFMPLCYNVFGSMGDLYMIYRTMKTPRRSLVIDSGTSVEIYIELPS